MTCAEVIIDASLWSLLGGLCWGYGAGWWLSRVRARRERKRHWWRAER